MISPGDMVVSYTSNAKGVVPVGYTLLFPRLPCNVSDFSGYPALQGRQVGLVLAVSSHIEPGVRQDPDMVPTFVLSEEGMGWCWARFVRQVDEETTHGR